MPNHHIVGQEKASITPDPDPELSLPALSSKARDFLVLSA